MNVQLCKICKKNKAQKIWNHINKRWTYFDTCKECEQKEIERAAAKDVAIKQNIRIKNASIPPEFKKKCEIECWLKPRGNYFLTGPTGRGKTHCAACLLKKAIKTGKKGEMFIWPEVIQELKLKRNSHAIFSEVKNLDAVVLDEFGTDETDASLKLAYLIINYWYNEQKQNLIVTSNQSLNDIASKLDDRISSRLKAMIGESSKFEGKNWRLDVK